MTTKRKKAKPPAYATKREMADLKRRVDLLWRLIEDIQGDRDAAAIRRCITEMRANEGAIA